MYHGNRAQAGPSFWSGQASSLSARGYVSPAGFGSSSGYGSNGFGGGHAGGSYGDGQSSGAANHLPGPPWQGMDEHRGAAGQQQLDIIRLREQLAREEAAAQHIRLRIEAANRQTPLGELLREPPAHASAGIGMHEQFAAPFAYPPVSATPSAFPPVSPTPSGFPSVSSTPSPFPPVSPSSSLPPCSRVEQQSLVPLTHPASLRPVPRDFSEADSADCWAMWVQANWQCEGAEKSRRPQRGSSTLSSWSREPAMPGESANSRLLADPSKYQHPLNDEEKRSIRKAVTQRCTRLYLEGQLRGFQILKPDLIFEKTLSTSPDKSDQPESSEQKESKTPRPSAQSVQVCGACGRKFAPEASECEKCGRSRDAAEKCSCGQAVVPDSKFCRKCGKQHVADYCISCGALLPSDAKFCCSCGRPRNTPRPPVICSCGNKLPNDAKTCRKCGAPRPEPESCVCGEPLRSDAKFCRKCGRQRPPPGSLCGVCGDKLAHDALFCQNCGNPRKVAEEQNAGAGIANASTVAQDRHRAAAAISLEQVFNPAL